MNLICLQTNVFETLTYLTPDILFTCSLLSRPTHSSCLFSYSPYCFNYYTALSLPQFHSFCTASRALDLETWLQYYIPTAFQVFVSFLPEVTLAVMITYLISVVAMELANNRPPKILALEC